jgi:hypothetical protein
LDRWHDQSKASLLWVAAGLAPVSVLAVLLLALTAPPSPFTAVAFPADVSSTGALAAVAEAGGAIVDQRLGGHIVVAAAADARFAEAARRGGALLVLPIALPAGCTATWIHGGKTR